MTKLDNDSSSLTARPSAGNMTKAAAKPPTRYQAREDDFYVSFIKQACRVTCDDVARTHCQSAIDAFAALSLYIFDTWSNT